MLFDPRRPLENLESALWLGALLLASGHEIEVLPDDLDALMSTYWRLFRPRAQA